MINAKNVYLRPMELSDVKIKVKWANDEQVRKTLGFSDYPVSELATEAWLRKSAGNATRKDFIICLKGTDERIGFCGIKNIDLVNLKAESYLAIGEVSHWGKGYGLETKQALLEYSFDHLNLNKVYSSHREDSKAMIKINLKLGGQQEGKLREEMRYNGVMTDMVLISVLKADFRKLMNPNT